jgi:hypothetical protein
MGRNSVEATKARWMRAVRAVLDDFEARPLVLLGGVAAFLCAVEAGVEVSGGAEAAVCAATGDTASKADNAAASRRTERGLDFAEFTALIF